MERVKRVKQEEAEVEIKLGQNFDVLCHDDSDEINFLQEVGTIVNDLWAIHRELRPGQDNTGKWVVTHIPTGLGICRGLYNEADAMELARRLVTTEPEVDWIIDNLKELEANIPIAQGCLVGIKFEEYEDTVIDG